jgi:dynein heavy chain
MVDKKAVKVKTDAGLEVREAYLVRRAACIFGVRREKVDKILQNFAAEDNALRSLTRFLDETDIAVCFFTISNSGDSIQLTLCDLPSPAQLKKKIIACVRAQPEVEITKESIDSQVVLLELALKGTIGNRSTTSVNDASAADGGVMDMLNTYCHSVYLSILTNPQNLRGWSDLISKDLMDKYHVFLANLHVTVGLMRGQTLLPLPPKEAVHEATGKDAGGGVGLAHTGGSSSSTTAVTVTKDRVHVLEGAVITWTKQIRHVLKQEPENVFRDGCNPEPIAEIQFWRNRAANLNSIHSQLQMDGVKKVLKFLETHKSTYTVPFSRLQKEVEDTREEANDNVRFLMTLAPHFEKLMDEKAEFDSSTGCSMASSTLYF